jgi:glycosyltransferase involved in cell wall biosynthesis
MKRCDFERVDAGNVRCKGCGKTYRYAGELERLRILGCGLSADQVTEALHQRARKAPPKAKRATADDLPCVHRSPDPAGHKVCELCSAKGDRVPVYRCTHPAIDGPVTIAKWTVGSKQGPTCLGCPQLEAPATEAPRSNGHVADVGKMVNGRSLQVRPGRGPLRVGLLSPVFQCGGVERHWLALCRHLPADRFRIAGIALGHDAPTHPDTCLEARRYGPIYATRRRGPVAHPDAEPVIERVADPAARLLADCDVVLWWATPDWAGRLGAFNRAGGRSVLISHGAADWTRAILWRSYRSASILAAVSQAAREAYPESVRSRVRVVLNGADPDRCCPRRSPAEVRASLGIPAGSLVVGFCGRFSSEKMPFDAIRTALEIPGAVALCAGDSFTRDAFVAKARQLGGRRVRFLHGGHVGDAYAAMDCLLVTSPAEGGPLVVLEAWLAGVPVVSTPVGAIPEIEAAAGCALTTPVRIGATPKQCARAVLQAVDRSQRYRVDAARLVAWQDYTSPRMAERWARLLLEG